MRSPAWTRLAGPALAVLLLLPGAGCAPAEDPEKLFADLQSTDGEVRQEASEKLDAIVDKGDPSPFVRGLSSPSLPIRAQSIVQLARMTSPEARVVLRGLLARDRRMMLPYNPIRLRPMNEKNDSRILVANLIHRGGGDPEAIDVLLRGAEENATTDLLKDTCLAIGALADPKGVPFLEKAALHPDATVARAAAQALAQFPGPEALASLKRLLEQHRDEQVRGEVLSGLTARDEPGVEDLLKRSAEGDASADLRTTAVMALQKYPDPALVPWLIGLLKTAPQETRPAIVQLLTQRTGQSLGGSPEAWQRWYARSGHPSGAAGAQ
jgi:HEAT repeat protein